MKKVILLLFVLAYVNSYAQGPYTIKLNFEKGAKYEFENIVNQVIEFEGEDPIKQTITIKNTLAIDDISAEGNYSCTFIYNEMSIINDAMPPDMKEAMSKSYNAMKGLGYKFVLTPTGKALSVSGVDEFVSRYTDSLIVQTDIPVAQRNMVYNQLKSKFSDSLVTRDLDALAGNYLPSKPVMVNDKWLIKQNTNLVVNKQNKFEYVLTKVNGNTGYLKCNIKSDAKGDADVFRIGESDLKMSGGGEYTIDMQTGMAITGTINLKGSGSMVMNGDKKKVKIDSTTTYSQYKSR